MHLFASLSCCPSFPSLAAVPALPGAISQLHTSYGASTSMPGVLLHSFQLQCRPISQAHGKPQLHRCCQRPQHATARLQAATALRCVETNISEIQTATTHAAKGHRHTPCPTGRCDTPPPSRGGWSRPAVREHFGSPEPRTRTADAETMGQLGQHEFSDLWVIMKGGHQTLR